MCHWVQNWGFGSFFFFEEKYDFFKSVEIMHIILEMAKYISLQNLTSFHLLIHSSLNKHDHMLLCENIH